MRRLFLAAHLSLLASAALAQGYNPPPAATLNSLGAANSTLSNVVLPAALNNLGLGAANSPVFATGTYSWITGVGTLTTGSINWAGNIATSGQILGKDGTLASPAFGFANETNTGLFRNGAGTLVFSVLGVNLLDYNVENAGVWRFNAPVYVTNVGSLATGLAGLAVRDTSAAFDVTLAGTSSTALTAGRALTLDMKNAAHTLAFNATANTITFPNIASYTVATLSAQTFTTGTQQFGATTPVHLASGQTTAPALTSCGTGSPSIVGSDTAGTVTAGTAATGCIITFNVAYTGAPYCVVTWRATALLSQSYAVSNTAITLTQTSTSGNLVDYICVAPSGG